MHRRLLIRIGSYAFAIGAVAACVLVRWLLNPLLENQGVYLAFMIPVASSAYLGGAGPGLLSAALSAAIASPYLSEFPVPDYGASITHLTLFCVEACAVVVLMQRLREGRARAEEASAAAEVARHVAEDATKAREQFMARVSHEWRSPLTTLTGWLWQIERRPADVDFVVRATASMKRAVDTQSRFVSDLLDYSRGSQGKLSIEPERLAIGEPVKSAVEVNHAEVLQHGLTIRVDSENSNARVWGDAVRLQQVFTNLLQNAIKFTPPGGTISIEFVTSPAAVEVKVMDTGVGIADDALPTIFRPFAQTNGKRDTKHGGLGLGLSIAKDIVELHGGSLSAYSAGLGTGATFVVRLPRAAVAHSIDDAFVDTTSSNACKART